MLNEIIEFAMNILENVVIIQIINSFFTVKNKYVEYFFILVFSILSFSINTMLCPLFLILATLILVLYTLYNNIGNAMYKILVSISVFGLNAYLSFIIVAGLNTLDTTVSHLLSEKFLFYVCIIIISKFILITIFSFIQTSLLKHIHIINWPLIFIELIVFFISVLISFYIYINSYISAETTFILLLIAAFVLYIIFYFFYRYQEYLRKKELNEIWEKERKDYLNQINQLHFFYDKVYFKTITLKQQFDSLRKTIIDGNKKESINLLNSINDQLPKNIEFDNSALDFLLNGKFQIMQEYNITFQAAVSISLKEISQDDIIFIIGNLLDSAIEQVKNKDGANISLHITQVSAGPKITIEYIPGNNNVNVSTLFSKIEPITKNYNGLLYYQKGKDSNCYKIIFMEEVRK